MENKIKDEKENNNSSIENKVNKLSGCLILVCVLLVILIVRLEKANGYLRTIAENGTNIIEYETFDDTFVEIETEEVKNKEDYVPLLEEITSETTDTVENVQNETTSLKDTTTETNSSTQKTDDNGLATTYVINLSSKKIHLHDCSFVARTKEENKKIVKLTHDELEDYISNGYTKCKTCGGN